MGRDQVHTRIVWQGGAPTTLEGPVTVGAFRDVSTASAMPQEILA